MNPLGRLVRAFRTLSLRFTTPLRIEFNLTDHCNLNCKGCTHYASIAPETYTPVEQLESDMRHLSSIRGHRSIRQVYLLGGEPLLYPHINEAITLARQLFPWAEISIFTNGLRLPRMDSLFWELCRQNDITLAVTRYPIDFDYDNVMDLCRREGVRVTQFGDRGEQDSFFKVRLDPLKRQNRWLSNFRCYSFGCLTVTDGKLFPCPQSACIQNLNRRFGYEFRWESGDYLNVSDITDAGQILRLRNRPVPFCSYCRKVTPTLYESSKRVKNEWIDEND